MARWRKVIRPVTATVRTELNAIQGVLAGVVDKSSEINVGADRKATIYIDHARNQTGAFTIEGTQYRIQASKDEEDDYGWRTIWVASCDITAPADVVINGGESAGATQFNDITDDDGLLERDILFLKNAVLSQSEWVRITDVVTDTTFDLEDPLQYDQAAGTYFNKGEQFAVTLNLETVNRLRVVCDNNGPGDKKNIIWRCSIVTSRDG